MTLFVFLFSFSFFEKEDIKFFFFFLREKISSFIPISWPNRLEQNKEIEMEHPLSKQYNLRN